MYFKSFTSSIRHAVEVGRAQAEARKHDLEETAMIINGILKDVVAEKSVEWALQRLRQEVAITLRKN